MECHIDSGIRGTVKFGDGSVIEIEGHDTILFVGKSGEHRRLTDVDGPGASKHDVDDTLDVLEFKLLLITIGRHGVILTLQHIGQAMLLQLLLLLLDSFSQPLDLTTVRDVVLVCLVNGAPLLGTFFTFCRLSRPLAMIRRLPAIASSSPRPTTCYSCSS
jgi:hypothetical protein